MRQIENGRSYQVKTDCALSGEGPYLNGARQGLVIGSSLFLLYLNYLTDSAFLFADDVKNGGTFSHLFLRLGLANQLGYA